LISAPDSVQASEGEGIRLTVGKRGKVSIARPVNLPEGGEIELQVEAKWLSGTGVLDVYFAAKPDDFWKAHIGPWVELFSDPSWPLRHWWAIREKPTFSRKITNPSEWSTVTCTSATGKSDEPARYLIIRVEDSPASWSGQSRIGVGFAIRSLRVRHIPDVPVEVALRSTWWEKSGLPVDLLARATSLVRVAEEVEPGVSLNQTGRTLNQDGQPVRVTLRLLDSTGAVRWENGWRTRGGTPAAKW
jgi:hypothetical protein